MLNEMKMAFFLEIMLWEMDLPFGMVGSSHYAPGCDDSSISHHGRVFLDMGLETIFSTAVTPVWTASFHPYKIASGGSSFLVRADRLS